MSRPSVCRAALVVSGAMLAAACGAAAGLHPVARDVGLGREDLVLVTTPTDVCVASTAVPPPCVPLLASAEPVVSASLTRFDDSADVVMVLAQEDVTVGGLGAGTADAPVRAGGRDLHVWLRAVPAGTAEVCASYAGPEGEGRIVVHRARSVVATEIVTVAPEAGDGC